MQKPRIIASVVIPVVLLAVSPVLAADSSVLAPNKRKAAFSFTLKDSTDAVVRLADYKGKVVLLNFWATWCGPCKLEIPWFMEFEKKYKAKGFAVVGISMDDDGWPTVRPYMEKLHVSYRMLMGNEDVATKFGGTDALPVTIFIDRKGRIAARHVGLASKSAYEQDILQMLLSPEQRR